MFCVCAITDQVFEPMNDEKKRGFFFFFFFFFFYISLKYSCSALKTMLLTCILISVINFIADFIV